MNDDFSINDKIARIAGSLEALRDICRDLARVSREHTLQLQEQNRQWRRGLRLILEDTNSDENKKDPK